MLPKKKMAYTVIISRDKMLKKRVLTEILPIADFFGLLNK